MRVMFTCTFVTFSYDFSGKVWYLIVSIPGLCLPFYLYRPQRKKTCLWGFPINNGTDQPVHPRSLISAFIICLFERIVSRHATSKKQQQFSSLFLDWFAYHFVGNPASWPKNLLFCVEDSQDGACHLKKQYNEVSTNLCISSYERAFAAHPHTLWE